MLIEVSYNPLISVESLVASCFSLLILLISVLSLSFLMSLAKDLSITPRSGAEAGRTPCPRGGSQEELPHNRGQGQWPRVPGCKGAGTAGRSYPCPRPGAGRSNPTSKEQWLRRQRRAWRSYSTFKVRRGGGEEIPLVQGKEQRLHFAGATVKRYPTTKVRETQVRW